MSRAIFFAAVLVTVGPLLAQDDEGRAVGREKFLRDSFSEVQKKFGAGAMWLLDGDKPFAGATYLKGGWAVTVLSALPEGKRTFDLKDAAGNRVDAELWACDFDYDLALLKLKKEPPGAKALLTGSELLLKKGQFVFTVAPEADSFRVSVVAQVGRSIKRLSEEALKRLSVFGILSEEFRGPQRPYVNVIQHDARFTDLMRGTPLIERNGNMVGVNLGSVFRGVVLAAPVTRLQDVLARLKEGRVLASYPYLGFRARTVTDQAAGEALKKMRKALRESGGDASGWGAEVTFVRGGTCADKAGLRKGDVITAVDMQPVWGRADIRDAARYLLPGMKVEFEVLRGRQRRRLTVTVGETSIRTLRLVLPKGTTVGQAQKAAGEAKLLLGADEVELVEDGLLVKTRVPWAAVPRHLAFAKTVLKKAVVKR